MARQRTNGQDDDRNGWQVDRQRDFTGGENRLVLPELLQPNQLMIARNCVMTADGLIETRKGKTKINLITLGAGPVISVHRYTKENGTKYLVVQHGTSLYAALWDGVSQQINDFGAAIKTNLNSARLRSVVWKDNLILTNGVDAMFRFDGAACTDLLNNPPLSKFIAVYGGKLWAVPVATPNRLQWSAVDNYDSWAVLDMVKIREGDGDVITGIAPQTNGMIVAKNRTVWPLYGVGQWDIEVGKAPIANKVGCIAPDSLLPSGFFLSSNGLYQFNMTGVQRVADTHRPMIDVLSLAEKEATIAADIVDDGRVLFMFGNSGVLNVETRYGGVLSWDGLNANCFAVANAPGDSGMLIIGSSTDGTVYHLNNIIDDNGIPISTGVTSAYRDFGTARDKLWRYVVPDIEPLTSITYPIHVRYDVDFGALSNETLINRQIDDVLDFGVDNWNEANWGGSAETRIKDIYWLNDGARGGQIAFSFSAQDRIKFLGYRTKYREVGRT